jgi:hypothetical protein
LKLFYDDPDDKGDRSPEEKIGDEYIAKAFPKIIHEISP